MKNNPLPRLDSDTDVRERLLPHCRLLEGDVWQDATGRHRVACVDAADSDEIARLMQGARAELAVHDPPYNLVAFEERALHDYIAWSKRWVDVTVDCLAEDASRRRPSAMRTS